jgi:hypothetical protein
MGKLVSQTDAIIKRLEAEGKVSYVQFTHEEIAKMCEEGERIKEEYKRKSAASWKAAKDIWLD